MRLEKLGKLLEVKYNLKSEGASIQEVIDSIKKDILNAYNLYIHRDKAKEPVLEMLAQLGEPFSVKLLSQFNTLVSDIDNPSPSILFRRINSILGLIHEMKSDPDKTVRNHIHDLIRVTKESEKNQREHIKSKFETVVSRLSSILEKKARILKAFLPKDVPLQGGAVEPQRKELSKDKLLMFMKTPAAQSYGLDNMEVMTRLLSFPQLRQKLTTLINAIDRGHYPIDGPEVAAEAAEIKRLLDQMAATNEPFFEKSEGEPSQETPTQRTEEDIINKYNSLTFDQWIRS